LQYHFSDREKELHSMMIKYFFITSEKGKLKVLDNNPLKYRYTGVTLPYIEKFVLKHKFSREEITNYIIKHHD